MRVLEQFAPADGATGAGPYPVRALSGLVLGFRFLALAVVTGAAVLLPADRVSRPILVAGILMATAVALIQHAAVQSGRHRLAAWLIVPHVMLWTLLIYATGGQGSPMVVGYLLELPLSGTLFSRRGVLAAGVAAIAFYLLLAWKIDGPLQPAAAATVVGFVAVCAAITWQVVEALERQRTQIDASRRALARRAESLSEELRLLGDYLSGGLIGIDEAGRIVSLNPCGASLLGIDTGSALGKAWQEVLRLDPVSRLRILETLDSGAPQRDVSVVLDIPTGRSITARADVWLCPAPRDRRVYVLFEPARAPATEDPMRRLGEAAACVAHQIKNSVHALQGFVRGLDRDAAGARVGALTTEQYVSALQGLGALAEDVLATAGASRPATERVAIRDVLQSATVLLGGAAIRVSLPESPLHAMANRSQLIHALFNLLDNAIRMSPPGRPVEVQAMNDDRRVVVEITDAGPGMPPYVASADGPVLSSSGAGLGLMAARRFVEASGGCLSFASLEGGGTRCRLELPAAMGAVAVGAVG